jgi:ElaB/YqjD/DUF883 family membrane-anchored ribosome-binding protein
MSERIEQAKRAADAAREELASTLTSLQAKLKPASLANQAWSGVRDKGSELADEAVEVVKARPAAAAAVLAAFGLFLARGQIVSAASRVVARAKNGATNEVAVKNGSTRKPRPRRKVVAGKKE